MTRNIKRVEYSKKFDKQLWKAPAQIQKAFKEKYTLFLLDYYHWQLNNHQLTGKYTGCRSINITGDWRAIFSEYQDKDGGLIIFFLFLGTHSQLYK